MFKNVPVQRYNAMYTSVLPSMSNKVSTDEDEISENENLQPHNQGTAITSDNFPISNLKPYRDDDKNCVVRTDMNHLNQQKKSNVAPKKPFKYTIKPPPPPANLNLPR